MLELIIRVLLGIFFFSARYVDYEVTTAVEERTLEAREDYLEDASETNPDYVESTEEEQEEQDLDQEEARIEPTDEHDREMLAILEEACGSQIYVYASVDMDKDGEREMIGVLDNASYFPIWYCSSDLKSCYEVMQMQGYDECNIEEIELDEERHVVIDGYNWIGTGKSYSILALHDGEIEVLVADNYGYVYMNDEKDIILDIEAYDGQYDKDDDIWLMHTWKDTYLYYEDGKYKEYGAATLSEETFLRYDNAQELLHEIEEEIRDERVVEARYSYFIRENGIVHIQCEAEIYHASFDSEWIEYFYYTLRENGDRLEGELVPNYGTMCPFFSRLDEVTYP